MGIEDYFLFWPFVIEWLKGLEKNYNKAFDKATLIYVALNLFHLKNAQSHEFPLICQATTVALIIPSMYTADLSDMIELTVNQ